MAEDELASNAGNSACTITDGSAWRGWVQTPHRT